jgi:hypothetical protein
MYVEFVDPIVIWNAAARTFVPSLQPSNVKPAREKPVASFNVMLAPLEATVGEGSVPAVEPFVL